MVTSTGMDIELPSVPGPQFPQNDRQKRILDIVEPLTDIAAENAPAHDRNNTFPHDTVAAVVESGYHTLTVPETYGGMGASALEVIMAQERLAQGDGSVALGLCMHFEHSYKTATADGWDEDIRARVLRDITENGALYNLLASEAGLGSPSRGGSFATTAERTDDGSWKLNGRKAWATLAPALKWAGIRATIVENGETGDAATFVVPMDADGVEIDETWDNMAMGSTGSHDVVLTDVIVPANCRQPASGRPSINPWGILTSGVYLGVAVAARNFAIAFAKTRKPAAMGGKSISTLPNVQQRVAEMELKLLQTRATLYGVLQQWEDHPELHDSLGWQLAAAKVVVTNNAIDITDQAMRIVGAAGLQRKHPLERYFRDVRAGINNPPLDDVAIGIIGRSVLGE